MPSRLASCGRTSRCDSRCSRRYASAVSFGGSASEPIVDDARSTVDSPRRARRRRRSARPGGAGAAGRAVAQAELAGRVPGVEHLPLGGDGGQADAPGGEVECAVSHVCIDDLPW